MANNRMVLVCNYCNPVYGEWSYKHPHSVLSLAKWFPGDAYYVPSVDAGSNLEWLAKTLHDFLSEHSHDGMEHPMRLEYQYAPDIDEYKRSTKVLLDCAKEAVKRDALLRDFDKQEKERSEILGRKTY